MNGTRATLAIARRDLSPSSLGAIGARILLGILLASFDLELAAPILVYAYCIIAATAAGLEIRVRDLTYFTAPLYGRQLARAHALTATCVAAAAPLTIVCVAFLRNAAWPLPSSVAMLAAAFVAALVALSGTLRQGAAAASYAFLSLAAGGLIVTLAQAGVPMYAWFVTAVLLGFTALRAFGETLARYDPLD
jgi:hypothetical protein